MNVNLISFGYNHGALNGAFLLVDVRPVRNPYYSKDLRNLNGYDLKVQKEVLSDHKTEVILTNVLQRIRDQVSAGTQDLTIGIGCTGGNHRSVVIAVELSRRLEEEGYSVILTHRDLR